MDEAFTTLMKEFIRLSMKDRKENKEVLKETRNCLTSIKIQLGKLETQSVADETARKEQNISCDKRHDNIYSDLKRIPTEKEKKNIEDRIISLEGLRPFIYKIAGGLVVISMISIPILKKLGIF